MPGELGFIFDNQDAHFAEQVLKTCPLASDPDDENDGKAA